MSKIKLNTRVTEGPIFFEIIKFVIPLMLTGVLQILYNMADNIVVGKFSGDYNALGAVGSTASLTGLITNIMIAFSAGAGVVIAQFYGAKNQKEVERSVHTAMSISLIGGIVCMAIGLAVARPVLKLMGTQEIYLEKAVLYMVIICLGIPASSVYNFGAAILRSVGDSKTSLYILSASGLINVALNLVFVILCNMSVDGVAVATIISQYISAIAVVIVLIKHKDECYGLNIRRLCLERRHVIRIMRIGIPMAFQSSLFSLSNMVITSTFNTFEPIIVEAKTIAFNIENLTYTVMHSFTNAIIAFIGQNYGARKYSRINKIFLYGVIQVAAFGILVSQIEILFGRQLSMLYIDATNPDKEAIIEAVMVIFKYMLSTYFLCGIMEVISGVLKALEQTIPSVIASLIGLVIRVGWLLFVVPIPKFHTIPWVIFAYIISWIATILLSSIFCAVAWKKLGISKHAKEEKLASGQ